MGIGVVCIWIAGNILGWSWKSFGMGVLFCFDLFLCGDGEWMGDWRMNKDKS